MIIYKVGNHEANAGFQTGIWNALSNSSGFIWYKDSACDALDTKQKDIKIKSR